MGKRGLDSCGSEYGPAAATLNTVMNIRVPLSEENFLTSWPTFSKRVVIYEFMYEGCSVSKIP